MIIRNFEKTYSRLTIGFFVSLPLLFAQTPGVADQVEENRRLAPLLKQIETFVKSGMRTTGVPGVAVAVVHHDRVVYLEGFGVRKVGDDAPIDSRTVFQLASLSKPIASTVVANLVGNREVDWDSKIVELDPSFQLSDPGVTERVTVRDLLSHRSGLPTSAGDALEDLGFSRSEILPQMRLLPLTGQFRKTFQYSNFGFTQGAIAASKAVRERWENLASERLFQPLGMKSTSYRYSDYRDAANKAAIHVIVNGRAEARYHRDPDAEAPAGAASSSARDLAEWLRLQLAGGSWEGQRIVAADALNETHSPQVQRGNNQETGKPSYYGLGWDVDYDAANRLILSHSGAFFLGTGTTVKFSPSEQLGIIVLTNAQPTGLAEATANQFFDLYHYGAPQQDWLTIFSGAFKSLMDEANNATTDYSKLTPPPSPAPSKPFSAYVGTYRNNYYGRIEISEQGGALWMRLPDTGALYTLSHWDGDTFTYRFEAEQGIGTRGVVFSRSGGAPSVLIENLALEGDGVFTAPGDHR
jgi:CubicO group peptidase (beta-lactamase class C family)